MLETSLATVLVVFLTQVLKKYVYPRFGETGVNVFVFTLALIFVVATPLFETDTARQILAYVLQTGTSAIAIYHVLLKHLEIGYDRLFPSAREQLYK